MDISIVIPLLNEEESLPELAAWIERVVIGLNFCPFAKAVYVKDQIRYVVSHAQNSETLLDDLERELRILAQATPQAVETTLLIHSQVLTEFLDYNDFLAVGDAAIERFGLTGVLQIASFHPAYQFAGTTTHDVENYTNRSPYPMLHLLREASITAIGTDPDALLEIPRRNVETLRRLGRAKILEMLKAVGEVPSSG